MPTIFMVLLVSYSFLDILSVFKLLMALCRHLIHYPFLDISSVTFALLQKKKKKKKVSHLLASTWNLFPTSIWAWVLFSSENHLYVVACKLTCGAHMEPWQSWGMWGMERSQSVLGVGNISPIRSSEPLDVYGFKGILSKKKKFQQCFLCILISYLVTFPFTIIAVFPPFTI